MEKDYENFLRNLLYIRSWGPFGISYKKEEDLPNLEKSLCAVKKYLKNEDIDELLETVNEYKKKGRIMRSLYFGKVKEKISQKAYEIVANGKEAIYKIIPELKPNERALLLDVIQKFLKVRKRFLTILESDESWKNKSEVLLEEMNSYIGEMDDICPWIILTTSYELYWSQRFLTDSKSGLSNIISNGYAIVREIMKKYNIEEEEIKTFSHAELEVEVEEKERTIEELKKSLTEKKKENENLMKQVEKLEKELEETKVAALPIDAKIEIEKRNKKIEELSQLLKSKEEYASNLESKLKEKEKEIEELKKKEVKFYSPSKENLDSLDEIMKVVMLNVSQDEKIKNIKPEFDRAFLKFSEICALRARSGDIGEDDLNLLLYFSQAHNVINAQFKESPLSQPNESVVIRTKELYGFYTAWSKIVKEQIKTELGSQV